VAPIHFRSYEWSLVALIAELFEVGQHIFTPCEFCVAWVASYPSTDVREVNCDFFVKHMLLNLDLLCLSILSDVFPHTYYFASNCILDNLLESGPLCFYLDHLVLLAVTLKINNYDTRLSVQIKGVVVILNFVRDLLRLFNF